MIDEEKVLFHIDWYFVYSSRNRWIGLRSVGTPNNQEEAWNNRTGKQQRYLLNFLPTLGIIFNITRWEQIKKDKKKK